MKLRKLIKKDAPLMLEWMQDVSVVHDLNTDFASRTLADCEQFIQDSQTAEPHLHLAIVNQEDEYMGTVSLKHISPEYKTAEFAITIRSCAMGKGYSQFGMHKILELGWEKLHLKEIYWCVSRHNQRAIRFYNKNHYQTVKNVPEYLLSRYTDKGPEDLVWYAASNGKY